MYKKPLLHKGLPDAIQFGAGFALILATMAIGVFGRHSAGFVSILAALVLIAIGLRRSSLDRHDLLFATMALAPFGVFWWASVFHRDTYGFERSFAADPQFWFEYGLTSAVLILGVLCTQNIERIARVALPVGLLAMFVWLTVDKFDPTIDPLNPSACRVRAIGGLPFTPAIVFSSFALFYFAIAERFATRDLWLAAVALTGAFVVTLGYTGARGALVGLMTGCTLTGGAMIVCRQRAWALRVGLLISAFLIGTLISIFVDVTLRCNQVTRFVPITGHLRSAVERAPAAQIEQTRNMTPAKETSTHQTTKPNIVLLDTEKIPMSVQNIPVPNLDIEGNWRSELTTDNSIAVRLLIWKTALNYIRESPATGSGRLAEVNLILPIQTFGHDHSHQQYLSWLIWFGILGLLAGIASLLGPIVALPGIASRQERFVLFASFCSILPVALLFDSLMRLSDYLVFQAVFSAVTFVVIRRLR